MTWHVQMRLRIEDDLLEEAKRRMAELAAELDARPKFLTCQAWLIDATEALKHQPVPKGRGTAYSAEHQGKTPRRLGRGPDA